MDIVLLVPEVKKRMAAPPDDEKVMTALEDAHSACLGYLGRKKLPEACKGAVIRTAVAFCNRMGIEGESSHSEGGVSMNVDPIPLDVIPMLRPWRLAITGA